MANNLENHRRKTIRLQGFDYSLPGAYFITANVQDRPRILSTVVNDQVLLTDFGRIVADVCTHLPDHYLQIEIDKFVVMPDHFHGIIILHENEKPYSISEIVRGFKTFSAMKINRLKGVTGQNFWQRNYYEHVIRDDFDLNRVRQYIWENPLKWTDGSGDISPSTYFS